MCVFILRVIKGIMDFFLVLIDEFRWFVCIICFYEGIGCDFIECDW